MNKFDVLINNYQSINNDISDKILKKQKIITIKFSQNQELKNKLNELKRLNTESIKSNSNIFVTPLLNNIKTSIEEILSKDLIYQTKIEKERVSILQKNSSLSKFKDDNIQLKNGRDTSEIYKMIYRILILIKYK